MRFKWRFWRNWNRAMTCHVETLQNWWYGCLGDYCGATLPEGVCAEKCIPPLEEGIALCDGKISKTWHGSGQASAGRRLGFSNSLFPREFPWDSWFIFQMFVHRARRPWTKTRIFVRTIRTATRDSKIQGGKGFDVLWNLGSGRLARCSPESKFILGLSHLESDPSGDSYWEFDYKS